MQPGRVLKRWFVWGCGGLAALLVVPVLGLAALGVIGVVDLPAPAPTSLAAAPAAFAAVDSAPPAAGQPSLILTKIAGDRAALAPTVVPTANSALAPDQATATALQPMVHLVGTAEATPTPAQPQGPTANVNANLRAGPGTNYDVVGGTQPGQSLDIVARNDAGDWVQLADGAWIFAPLVANAPLDLPVAQNIPEPPPPPPVAVEPIAAPLPTATPQPQTQPSAPAAEPGPEASGETLDQSPAAAQVILQSVHYDLFVARSTILTERR